MPNNPYFVFDGKLCKAEGMTKEQIYNAIAEATGQTPTGVDDAFISTILETNNNQSVHIWYGTEAEYNALQSYDPNTLYIVDGDSTVDDMFAALDEANEKISELQDDMTEAQTDIDNLETSVTSLYTEYNRTLPELADAADIAQTLNFKDIRNQDRFWQVCDPHVSGGDLQDVLPGLYLANVRFSDSQNPEEEEIYLPIYIHNDIYVDAKCYSGLFSKYVGSPENRLGMFRLCAEKISDYTFHVYTDEPNPPQGHSPDDAKLFFEIYLKRIGRPDNGGGVGGGVG